MYEYRKDREALTSLEFRRQRKLRERYGLTPTEYESLSAQQAGQCAICKASGVLLHVDHDHNTNRIRGLLCGLCNRGLGLFRDSPDLLIEGAKYLKRVE
jgi:hypothetical protein